MLITPLYWSIGILLDYDSFFKIVDEIVIHVYPIFILFIDFGLSQMPIYASHFTLISFVLLIYMGYNAYNSVVYKPVYYVLTYKDLTTYLLLLGGVGYLLLIYALVFFIAKFKNKKYK